MASFSVNVTFKSNLALFRQLLAGNLSNAMADIRDEAVDWVHEKMLHGYSDRHGPDGHTAIYDTGALYNSIKADIKTNLLLNHELTIGTDMEYAVFVHNGTRKLKGRPFIRDALIENQSKIPQIIKDAGKNL